MTIFMNTEIIYTIYYYYYPLMIACCTCLTMFV